MFIEVTPDGTVQIHAPTGKINVFPFGDVIGEQFGIATFAVFEETDVVPEPQRLTGVIRKM